MRKIRNRLNRLFQLGIPHFVNHQGKYDRQQLGKHDFPHRHNQRIPDNAEAVRLPEENFKIGTVSDDFMFEFGNDKPLHDADVFLFNIKYGGYKVKSTNELILYEPVNPFLLPIVVPID